MRIYLNENWCFTENYTEDFLKGGEKNITEVRLPHTCKELPYHYFDEHLYQMISGYRRTLFAPGEWKGKKILLTFEGIAHVSEVFLNGEKIGEHRCGYTAFTLDISEKLVYGSSNTLVVKADSRESLNVPPFGFVIDYMTYGGIYRDVYLEVKNPEYLADVFVKSKITSVSEKKAELITEIALNTEKKGALIRQSLKKAADGAFEILGERECPGDKLTLSFLVENAALWDTKHPVLYEVKTELLYEGELLDEKFVRFGFRKAEFKTDGFYLNDKKLKIRGLNRHQSYPYTGYAMPESMQKLDADILKKELGVNAVRTSHYPQSHYFLERCDELGLLVFTEIPGWQHIGNEEWKEQAVENVKDMILQYRNHTSIILWGVRINESSDDDDFYTKTNEMAHKLDDSRPTGGVRASKKSNLLEDVYTYNDFVHAGNNKGCEKKKDVTSDVQKPYLISEYNGHMYPTKAFDWEEHRVEHALRHANVLNAVTKEEDISGCFGWCMFDYNTHKDFGSGDRICYHGVLDMFRNHKLAAAIYACEQEEYPVLELSSSMDIGEHPGCNRGETYIFTNADKVKMYKNERFIKEYVPKASPYTALKHGPIVVDDFVGDALKAENFKPKQEAAVKKLLNATARFGLGGLPKSIYASAAWLILRYHMSMEQAVVLYNRYIGDWGGTSTAYRFEAIKVNEATGEETIVKTIEKKPMKEVKLTAEADHHELVEKNTYDVAAIRILAKDENDNVLSFFQEPVSVKAEGAIEIIGPESFSLHGGMGGCYVRTRKVEAGKAEKAYVRIKTAQAEELRIDFTVKTQL